MSQSGARPDDFTYTDSDRFPAPDAQAGLKASATRDEADSHGSAGLQAGQVGDAGPKANATRTRGPVLGLAVAEDPVACAAAVAAEIERILRDETVRDRKTGVPRQARPGDIAILFRSRTSHREFEHELEVRGDSNLRVQRPRLLRRGRDQGPLRADALPRGSRIQPAGGGVPALPFHPHLGSRPGAAGARAWPPRSPILSCRALRRRSTTRIAACSCTSAGA